jgi:hypothetical protein
MPDNELGHALPIHTIGHAGVINHQVRGVVAEKKSRAVCRRLRHSCDQSALRCGAAAAGERDAQ